MVDPYDAVNRALSGGPLLPPGAERGLGARPRSKFRAPRVPAAFAPSNAANAGTTERRVSHVPGETGYLAADEEQRQLADAIAYAVARALHRSPSTPVRPPSHTCPPVRAVDFDLGIRPTADYTTLSAGATVTLLAGERLHQGWYGTLLGMAWTVAWDGATAGNPYLSCPVTLLINGNPHEQYSAVTLQLTSSLAALVPVTIPIPPKGESNGGSTIGIQFTNTHATDAMRIAARVKGYQFPVSGHADGIHAGLVEG